MLTKLYKVCSSACNLHAPPHYNPWQVSMEIGPFWTRRLDKHLYPASRRFFYMLHVSIGMSGSFMCLMFEWLWLLTTSHFYISYETKVDEGEG